MTELLDDFANLSGWIAVASGEARLDLVDETDGAERALTLDFDFKGGGGFVVARRELRRPMPPVYTLTFRLRGEAPANRLEVKLVDTSGRNVWWHRREAFQATSAWQSVSIRSREIEFAWGPAGGGVLRELGAIEIGIVAPPGGRGRISIAELRLEDRSRHPTAIATASRELADHAAAAVVDGDDETSWRSGPTTSPERLELDFGEAREHGGFVVEWEPGLAAADFDVLTSLDRRDWSLVRSVRGAAATRSYLYAAGGEDARYLRLDLQRGASSGGFGIRALEVAPFDFSRSIESFFAGIAAREPRGRYPRWLYGEQAYWTPIAVAEGSARALLNEDGLLELGRAAFSLEPALGIEGRLHTWHDAERGGGITQRFADGWLPIPSVEWRTSGVVLTTTVFATRERQHAAVVARYRVENTERQARTVTLYVAVRPFQVDPPWQAFRGMGGTAKVESIELADGILWVNESRALLLSPLPDRFGAATFDDGAISGYLARDELPAASAVHDAFAYASAALAYDLELAPGAVADVVVAAPFARVDRDDAPRLEALRVHVTKAETFDAEREAWRSRFATVRLDLGDADRSVADTVKSAASHILTNRYGPAIQPGPRRYTRSWIRDAATMSAALLRMGRSDEVRDFLRWYAPYQATDGNVPCCVDELGPDWLVEHDSHGQLVFAAAEHFRFTQDRTFLAEMWPHVEKAASYIEALRALRCTPEYARGERQVCYGLLPESVSHEGYLAQPVHAYWDDFWALRGAADAAEVARALGERADADRFATLARELADSLYASIDLVISRKNLAYVPGSVEWADFDPSATAIALQITDAADRLPADKLDAMFEEYLKGFRRRRDGETDWNNYTAYEIRNIAALVRLERRSEANELLDYFLADRRPRAWNQWPEISWRNPRSGGHLGDLPHSWIGAEYVLAVLSMLAYERHADRALVVAAGVPGAWLAKGRPLRVRGLPTYYGTLDSSLVRVSEDELRLSISTAVAPPGGVVLRPPLSRPLGEVTVDGRNAAIVDADGVTIPRGPAEVVFRF